MILQDVMKLMTGNLYSIILIEITIKSGYTNVVLSAAMGRTLSASRAIMFNRDADVW